MVRPRGNVQNLVALQATFYGIITGRRGYTHAGTARDEFSERKYIPYLMDTNVNVIR